MLAQRLIASLALATLTLASLAFFCMETRTTMLGMSEHVKVQAAMADCTGTPCVGRHMQSLFQAIPSTSPGDLTLLREVVGVALFAALAARLFADATVLLAGSVEERLRRRRRWTERGPRVLAFSRGIIHSKRYV